MTTPSKAGARGAGLRGHGRYGKGDQEYNNYSGIHDNGGSAARFFYCAKASKRERDAGCEGSNGHPTLKPIALTEYLARLILPPKEYSPRRILVPFSGSGSEMIGAHRAGWEEITGVEMTEEYCQIAEARLKHWVSVPVQMELK